MARSMMTAVASAAAMAERIKEVIMSDGENPSKPVTSEMTELDVEDMALLADQFATTAPPVPEWFSPRMPKRPDHPHVIHSNCFKDVKSEDMGAVFNSSVVLPPESEKCRLWRIEVEKWFMELEGQRFVQWPYTWARIQLSERGNLVRALVKAKGNIKSTLIH